MLRNALKNSLLQIADILDAVDSLPYAKAQEFYVQHNAGKHIRHVIDHILAFMPSLETGTLDYNLRNRESKTERCCETAKSQINDIFSWLDTHQFNDRNLKVISEIDSCATVNQIFKSNVHRESLYLINHTVHHAAYIRLLAKTLGIELAEHIGIAPSTATHLRQTGT